MNISSPAFDYGAPIPPTYSQEGDNISPPLSFSNVPVKAKSLALVVDDPDAPRGTFTHWVVFNIDPRMEEIRENAVPAGAKQGLNTAGQPAYRGPKPPDGTHRYFFRIYAIDTRLPLENGAPREAVERAIEGHVIETAELMGRYTTGSAATIR